MDEKEGPARRARASLEQEAPLPDPASVPKNGPQVFWGTLLWSVFDPSSAKWKRSSN